MELLEEDLRDGRRRHRRRPAPGRQRAPRAAAALGAGRRAARPLAARRRRASCARSRSSSASSRAPSPPSSSCARASATSSSTSCRPPSACWGRGDPDAVARVVRILLDNALRYGPPRRADRRSSRGATAAARDDRRSPTAGPGVPPEEREHIFERFHRGRGAGLGERLRPRPGDRARAGASAWAATLELADGDGRGARFVLDAAARLAASSPAPVACTGFGRGGVKRRPAATRGDARSARVVGERTAHHSSERSADERRPRRLPAAERRDDRLDQHEPLPGAAARRAAARGRARRVVALAAARRRRASRVTPTSLDRRRSASRSAGPSAGSSAAPGPVSGCVEIDEVAGLQARARSPAAIARTLLFSDRRACRCAHMTATSTQRRRARAGRRAPARRRPAAGTAAARPRGSGSPTPARPATAARRAPTVQRRR